MLRTMKDKGNEHWVPSRILGALLTLAAAVVLVIFLRDAWAGREGAIGSGELIWLVAALAGIGAGLWAGLATKLYEVVVGRLGGGGK